MFKITGSVDTSRVDALLRRGERRVISATATALTKVAIEAKAQIERDMPRVFDRPTRWTLGALRFKPATKEKLESAVLVKDRDSSDEAGQLSHLWPEIRGGQRRHKPFEGRLRRQAWIDDGEYLVPADGAPSDAYGNVPASVIRQILSQLGAANAADNSGYNSNIRKGAAQSAQRKRRQLKAGSFFIPPRGGPLPRGIYQRKRTGFGWATRAVFWITRRPSYKARLPWVDTVERVRRERLQGFFDAELARISD